jgi:hypothetical protein
VRERRHQQLLPLDENATPLHLCIQLQFFLGVRSIHLVGMYNRIALAKFDAASREVIAPLHVVSRTTSVLFTVDALPPLLLQYLP